MCMMEKPGMGFEICSTELLISPSMSTISIFTSGQHQQELEVGAWQDELVKTYT